jgi:prepilin peptidase CpaA
MLNNWPVLLLLGCLLGLAVGYDVSARRIPNWLALAGLIAGVGCSLVANHTAENLQPVGIGVGLADSLIGALSGLVIMLPLYALRAMGGGDVKLMAAIGAFLGPMQVLGAALLTFAAGGVLSLIVAFCSGSLPRVLGNLRLIGMVTMSSRSAGLSLKDVQTTGRLPYAIAIAIGTGLQVWLAARGGWIFV